MSREEKGAEGLGAAETLHAPTVGARPRARQHPALERGSSIGRYIVIDRIGDARRMAVRARFEATGLPFAKDTAVRTIGLLDAWSARWAAARTQSCEATHRHGEQSEALLALKMQCLDRRQLELGALVTVLEQADGKVVEEAVQAVGRLASPDECRDARSLTEPPPPPAGSQAAIEAISRQLAEAKALYAAGRYAGARPPAAAATEAARRLGYAPLVAEAAYLEARVAMVLAEGDRAEKLYEEAILAGIEGRTDELAARVAVEYVHAVGVERARPADAHERAKLAAALIGRLGRPELLSAELDAAIGSVYRAEGKPAEAKLHLERAVPIIERTHGVDSLDLARVYNQLGILHFTQGRYAEAAGWFDRVRWIRVARQGPDHPQVGNVLVNLGVMQTHTGRHAEATATFERALAILEPKIGPHHVTLVKLNNNIGLLLARQGRYEEALARHEQAYAIYRNVAGATEVDSAATLINTALAQRNLGRIAEAKELNRRVMAIYEKAFGPGHPDLAYPLIELALCLLAEGKPDEAIPLLRRSRVVREGNEEDPAERAEAELALARALWDAGRDRKEAIEQAARARDHYAEAEKTDPSYGKERAAAESWLAAHTAP